MDQLSSVLSNNNNIHLNTNFELLEPFEGVQPNLISKKAHFFCKLTSLGSQLCNSAIPIEALKVLSNFIIA